MSENLQQTATTRAPVDDDLLRRTVRAVVLFVAASVLFVGALSIAAVVITSKAMGASERTSSTGDGTDGSGVSKKPLSI